MELMTAMTTLPQPENLTSAVTAGGVQVKSQTKYALMMERVNCLCLGQVNQSDNYLQLRATTLNQRYLGVTSDLAPIRGNLTHAHHLRKGWGYQQDGMDGSPVASFDRRQLHSPPSNLHAW